VRYVFVIYFALIIGAVILYMTAPQSNDPFYDCISDLELTVDNFELCEKYVEAKERYYSK
jgi:hypothetical protein